MSEPTGSSPCRSTRNGRNKWPAEKKYIPSIYIYNSEDFDTQGIHNSFDQTQLFTLKQRPRFSFQLNKEKKLQGANYGILEYTDTTDTNLRKGQANPPGNQLLSSPNQKGSPW